MAKNLRGIDDTATRRLPNRILPWPTSHVSRVDLSDNRRASYLPRDS